MSTFNEIEMTTPYGDTDNVLELNIDASSDAYVLQNVIKLPSTYTFSIWYRAESDSQITFNVLGKSETVDSTTTWNKFVKTVTAETLDETNIYIMPSVGVNSYLYEGYLSEGITDTSWLPAPEDIEGEIGSVRSELVQTADRILARVSASDGRISTLETNLEGITGRVEDAEGNISKVSQTVDGVTTEISDAKGSSTTLKARLDGIDVKVEDVEGNITQLKQTNEEISLKAGNAEKMALESKVLSVNLSVETMTVATDTDGNNGNYSNCKTIISVSYGIEDVTVYATINCTPSDGMDYSIDFTSKTCSISNMTVDTGTVEISATYTTTIDNVEQTLSATRTFSVTKSKQGVAGEKGDPGDSIGIKSMTTEYYLSTSDTEIIGGEWNETPPVKTDDTYIWKREHTIYDDGTTSYSSPVLDASLNKLFEVTAELTVGQEEIVGKVNDLDGKYTEVKQTSDSVTLFIGDENLDGSTTLQATIDGIKSYVEDEDGKVYSTIEQKADSLTQTFVDADKNLETKITESSEGWQGSFKKLGMYDENSDTPTEPDNSEESCSTTLVTIDYDGMTVEADSTSSDGRIKTTIKNGIYGENENKEDIFHLDQEGCHTGRVYMDRGFEMGGMKMIPTNINGVNFWCCVKVGGTS